MNKARLERAVGGLTKTTKMPCLSWSIPRSSCRMGAQLAVLAGTVCEKCYARKGRYTFPNVRTAQERRLKIWAQDRSAWVNNMILRLGEKDVRKSGLFRWFDSGDLQGREMLEDIIQIAKETPFIKHRLPTKEYGVIAQFSPQDLPKNLILQVSAPRIDVILKGWVHGHPITNVTRDPKKATCPGKCDPCFVCWDRSTASVVYLLH